MVPNRDTFAGDVLARLGLHNVFAGHADRYPTPGRHLTWCGPALVESPQVLARRLSG